MMRALLYRDWLMHELDGRRFFDARLAKRLQELAIQLWTHLGRSIPMACQDWANTKAAYRFLANENVHEDVILEGHFRATRERFKAAVNFRRIGAILFPA